MSGSEEEEASGDLYYLTVVYGRSTHRAHSACAGRRVARYPPPCRPPPTPAPLTSPAAAASPSPSPARGGDRAGRARRKRGGSLRGVRATALPDHSSGPNHLGREHAGSALGQLALPMALRLASFEGGCAEASLSARSRPDHDQITPRSRPDHDQITTRSRPDHDQVTTRSRPDHDPTGGPGFGQPRPSTHLHGARARLRPASAKHALARR